MEKEQIFEMPMPELGSLPPPACARPRQQPHPQCCFNLAPETEGLLSLFPCPQLAISSLPRSARPFCVLAHPCRDLPPGALFARHRLAARPAPRPCPHWSGDLGKPKDSHQLLA